MAIEGRDDEFRIVITDRFQKWLGHDPFPAQMDAYLTACRNGWTIVDIDAQLSKEPESIAYLAKPPAPATPHLEVQGSEFVDASGRRTSLCGCDGFLDYRIWLNAREAGLEPFLVESNTLGFTVRRVFLAGASIENQVFDLSPLVDDGFYAQLVPFVRFENAHGIIPLLTVHVDMQRVMPHASDRLHHWQLINAELRGEGLAYLMSGGNQWSKNGWNPWEDVDGPGGGVIWSRGSDVEDVQTFARGATASELHATRVSVDRSLMDAVASPVEMRKHGAGMVWMTEGKPFDQDSDVFQAWQLGRVYATCWALAIFHDRQGQRGLLRNGRIRECAAAWAEGMRLR